MFDNKPLLLAFIKGVLLRPSTRYKGVLVPQYCGIAFRSCVVCSRTGNECWHCFHSFKPLILQQEHVTAGSD